MNALEHLAMLRLAGKKPAMPIVVTNEDWIARRYARSDYFVLVVDFGRQYELGALHGLVVSLNYRNGDPAEIGRQIMAVDPIVFTVWRLGSPYSQVVIGP